MDRPGAAERGAGAELGGGQAAMTVSVPYTVHNCGCGGRQILCQDPCGNLIEPFQPQ